MGKQKKNKKTISQDSCLLTLSPDFWNIVFFCLIFFGFLEVFRIFAFLLLQESWNIVFSCFSFVWFSRGFLNFGIFTFAGVLEYCILLFLFGLFGFLEVFWIFAFLLHAVFFCVFVCVFFVFFCLFLFFLISF